MVGCSVWELILADRTGKQTRPVPTRDTVPSLLLGLFKPSAADEGVQAVEAIPGETRDGTGRGDGVKTLTNGLSENLQK